MNIAEVRLFARSASVYIKIAAGLSAILAAYLWFRSVGGSITFNEGAAIFAGVSALFQAAAAFIDAWISPTASWH
jgi:hypothetical protein